MLFTTEKNYWFTKLKMTALVWIVKKFRFMIFFANYLITVFIDHDVNSSIVNQIKLSISVVNKFNFKLIKASMYLSQFRIKTFHRSEKSNIIFDVLFRLLIVRSRPKNHIIDNLNVDEFNIDVADKLIDTLVQMTNDFRKKLVNGYKNDSA